MDDTKPNLLDPDFEPTDEQLHEITEAAWRTVIAQSAELTATEAAQSGAEKLPLPAK